ncbi:hypothetical protein BH11ARM2_BH11ARM2_02840 [soil metagenome]
MGQVAFKPEMWVKVDGKQTETTIAEIAPADVKRIIDRWTEEWSGNQEKLDDLSGYGLEWAWNTTESIDRRTYALYSTSNEVLALLESIPAARPAQGLLLKKAIRLYKSSGQSTIAEAMIAELSRINREEFRGNGSVVLPEALNELERHYELIGFQKVSDNGDGTCRMLLDEPSAGRLREAWEL